MASQEISLETIREKVNHSPVHEWKADIDKYENFLIEELNQVSTPYRTALHRLSLIRKALREECIRNCEHDFERFSEYHNDVYFICRKCGYEK